MQTVFVTGASGFIGSSLVDALLANGKTVIGWDNFSTGRPEFLKEAKSHPAFTLIEGDNLDAAALARAMKGCDFVFHLAANADVRFGVEHPGKDFEQNTTATFHVLEGVRTNGIRGMAFSSTGSVYGEAQTIPTPEECPFPIQTSLYGASKLAGEGMIQAYCEGFGIHAYIFRFVSILGPRYTHGHIIDFYKQLMDHPNLLKVLGDGTQRKSYLYVHDCVRAIMHVIENNLAAQAKHHVEIFNLGTDEYCTVRDSVGWICAKLGVTPTLQFSGGDRGWIGDNPFIYLDTSKVRNTGWAPKLNIQQSVEATVDWLKTNEWVFDKPAVSV
ncbi:MAG TPA: NAD-dependent epimerase/dehydratase family protein [Acidobacteriaceae bacterium]|nr:NAD-dependent epimerase/dehydratase family protein [Acidobacteriaceae bacterium]